MHRRTRAESRDIETLALGKELGRGIGRSVFLWAPDSTLVCKIEGDARSFQNINEWELWRRIQNESLAQYFAPCVKIGPNGIAMLQRRTYPLAEFDLAGPDRQRPKLPAFVFDRKPENCGWLVEAGKPRRIVIHDYGFHDLDLRWLRAKSTLISGPRDWASNT